MLQNETYESILPSCAAWKQCPMITWLISNVSRVSTVSILHVLIGSLCSDTGLHTCCRVVLLTVKDSITSGLIIAFILERFWADVFEWHNKYLNKENSLFLTILNYFRQILVAFKYFVQSDWRIIVKNLELPYNAKLKTQVVTDRILSGFKVGFVLLNLQFSV